MNIALKQRESQLLAVADSQNKTSYKDIISRGAWIDTPRMHLDVLHGGLGDGYVALATKDPEFDAKVVKLKKAYELIDATAGKPQQYISQNSFMKPVRNNNSINRYHAIFVDIDCLKKKGLDPEFVYQRLEIEVFGEAIPEPNLVSFTGRGLALVYLLEPTTLGTYWNDAENRLIEAIKRYDVGVDEAVKDGARVLRLAGTVNAANGAICKIQFRYGERWDLLDLMDELPKPEPKRKTSTNPAEPGKVKDLSKVRVRSEFALSMTATTRLEAKVSDLETLVHLRQGRLEGSRELLLFWYRAMIEKAPGGSGDGLKRALELNELLSPPLPTNEVIRDTKSAAEKEYEMSNQNLIALFEITPEEQKHMKILIGRAEKTRRSRLSRETKRREAGKPTKDERIQQRKDQVDDNLQRLIEAIKADPTATNQVLATKLGVSLATIKRYKNQAKDQGML